MTLKPDGMDLESIEAPTATFDVEDLRSKRASTRPPDVVARLVCVAGADLGRMFRVSATPLVIGRGDADVVLQAADISRKHAQIRSVGSEYVVDDLGSANGTQINGASVKQGAPLRFGDRIELGSSILLFARHDELEDRMHQLKRLEAMGQLAGGLAHDFNNALTVVISSLELLADLIPAGLGEPQQLLREATDAATAAGRLAKQLLRLGKGDAQPLVAIELAPLVGQSVAWIRRQLGNACKVVVDVPSELKVRGSSDELQQVLLNLFINARDAMPNGGTLRIEAKGVTYDVQQASAEHLARQGDYVVISVVDSGIGMDEATVARAFDPFFTTKAPGKGTGLGLAMIHGIVRRCGGAVTVESTPGLGTTFQVVLPRA